MKVFHSDLDLQLVEGHKIARTTEFTIQHHLVVMFNFCLRNILTVSKVVAIF